MNVKIDRDKLRTVIRKMGNEYVYYMLADALELLPPSKLAKLVGRYLDMKNLQSSGPQKNAVLLAEVRSFEKASRAGEYYESFSVNSKNDREMSRGTRAWISECKRLLNACVGAVHKANACDACEAFEIIFSLLRHIDECLDDIIFFADEAGSWQVGIDWQKVLPAWFACLSATVEPEEYARRVVDVVDCFEKHDRDKHLTAASRKASAAQRKALVGKTDWKGRATKGQTF